MLLTWLISGEHNRDQSPGRGRKVLGGGRVLGTSAPRMKLVILKDFRVKVEVHRCNVCCACVCVCVCVCVWVCVCVCQHTHTTITVVRLHLLSNFPCVSKIL